jgi:hypothetical protein
VSNINRKGKAVQEDDKRAKNLGLLSDNEPQCDVVVFIIFCSLYFYKIFSMSLSSQEPENGQKHRCSDVRKPSEKLCTKVFSCCIGQRQGNWL